MAAKRILLTDGSGLVAHYWRAGRITIEAEFSNEPAGLEALASYIKKHRSSLFFLLADIAEEGFQLEDLPYVQGGDRNALLQRRLSQYFYNTPLSLAISLGRAKDGRRDEKILFAALTRAEAFAPWLDTLRESEAILAGVYSVPLVLAQLGPQLLDTSDPVLLLTLSRGGVRQTFFDQGKLHFSRLSQLATRSVDEVGRVCASDSAKIFQYLVAQRQIPRGGALRTVILAEAAQTRTLQDYCQSSTELQFEFADLGAAARKLKLKDLAGDSNADKLLMHRLATRAPDQQFAQASETRFHRLWKIRSALTSVAWVVFVACLLFAGKTGLKVAELQDQTELTRLATAEDTRRYDVILDGLPKVNLTPDNLRTLTSRYDALQKRLPAMEPMLVHLSQALNENPRIELGKLTWRMADRPDAAANSAPGPKPAVPASPNAAAGWILIEIEAQLPLVLVSDQRAQLALIDSFATRLQTQQTDVRVLSRPFDIESDKALRSAGDARAVSADVPKFSLRLARPL
ncbi:MAG: hypothetical protein HZA62_15685 [Rhodocyclales bacterium]|nr:hypothetical protein [Rhodocyclales bacterium]